MLSEPRRSEILSQAQELLGAEVTVRWYSGDAGFDGAETTLEVTGVPTGDQRDAMKRLRTLRNRVREGDDVSLVIVFLPKSLSLAIALVPDVPSSNGRIYPRDVLVKAFHKFADDVPGTLFDGTSAARNNIDLADISHLASNPRIEGDEVKIDVQVLDTPAGERLAELITEGRAVLTLRGRGRIVDNVIQDDYSLESVDVIDADLSPRPDRWKKNE